MIVFDSFSSYHPKEESFVRYFDRLYAVGFSIEEIKRKLPQLRKYYNQMVGNIRMFDIFEPKNKLEFLFEKWKKSKNLAKKI